MQTPATTGRCPKARDHEACCGHNQRIRHTFWELAHKPSQPYSLRADSASAHSSVLRPSPRRATCTINRLRRGLKRSLISSNSRSLMYFHLPPLALSLATSRPTNTAMPRCTPRSPTESDVGALEPEAGKHLDAPPAQPRAPPSSAAPPPRRRAPRRASSPSLARHELVRQPLEVLGLALREAAARSRSIGVAATCEGAEAALLVLAGRVIWPSGAAGGGGGSRGVVAVVVKQRHEARLMALAAAPLTCWLMMPLARLSNGSICSASPRG